MYQVYTVYRLRKWKLVIIQYNRLADIGHHGCLNYLLGASTGFQGRLMSGEDRGDAEGGEQRPGH